ncbi:CBM_HP2_G0032350.mRNA.1.CDS.1 [Saccharomyces cerevisiae]|nr:CBM_HP2_G0032350.mRNA.1.CDS.1 [Saccharomyces cerevisiae]CAI6586811.1 CBM_HP2_G0032350.mRNA.1.CDS.1 [Saccharomyces cerevisiae]
MAILKFAKTLYRCCPVTESIVSSSIPLNSLGISMLGPPTNSCSTPQSKRSPHTKNNLGGHQLQ